MPWTGEVGAFFGRVQRCDKNGFYGPCEPVKGNPLGVDRLLPPDLVIQDELHLISGPLGTICGLYETALDELCSRMIGEKKVGPKIVASTATVRRAENQIRALFNRRLVDIIRLGLMVERVVLVHRLREVVAQVGFTRFEAAAPDIEGELEIGVRRATLAREITWLPAVENKGEGIFLQFNREQIEAWEQRPDVQDRGRKLMAGFDCWKNEHHDFTHGNVPAMFSPTPVSEAHFSSLDCI